MKSGLIKNSKMYSILIRKILKKRDYCDTDPDINCN